MKVKLLVGALLFLIAVNLATIGSYVYLRFSGTHTRPYFNREYMNRHPFGRGPGPGPALQLNRQQRQQLFNLLKDFRQETEPQRRQIDSLERKTFQLMQQQPVQMDSINSNLKQISDIRYMISQQIIKKLMAAKSYLNPRQQHQFYNAIMRARVERSDMPPPPNTPLPQP